jgi:uncharacterized protein YqeY
MSLIEQIRAQKMEARKAPERAVEVAILNLLLGEIETIEKRTGKSFSDADVVGAVKKLIKSNDETLKLQSVPKLVIENEVLNKLLPQQLSEQELRVIIADNALTDIKSVMQFLNTNFAGQFDKGLASNIARSL